MLSKLKKSDVAQYGLVILILLVVAIVVHFVIPLNHGLHNGRDYIPKIYDAISLPSSIKYVSKYWEDQHANDPAFYSNWFYEYDIAAGQSHSQLNNDFQTSLLRSNYFIVEQASDEKLDAFHIEATNNKIRVHIYVGYGCSNDTCANNYPAKKVITSASLADRYPGFWLQ